MKKIKVSNNGPYIIDGTISIQKITIEQDKEGNSVAWKDGELKTITNPHLCRCGATNNAPFCDGSHIKINFNGDEAATNSPFFEEAQSIIGPVISLLDNEKFCAYARFCDTFGGIWNTVSSATTEQEIERAKQQSKQCPSGRLIVWDNQNKPKLTGTSQESIGYIEDLYLKGSGPLRLLGNIEIQSENKDISYEIREKVTLCRCGQSYNKPFCDGNHAPAKYKANYKQETDS